MALTGVPQWFNARSPIAVSGAGTSAEVDRIGGINNPGNVIASEALVSHTITAGPTTAGPVIVQMPDGSIWALPFNTACTAPDAVWQELRKSSDAFTAGQWTWA